MDLPARVSPKFLDLRAIRFPIGAVASILHRVSGVVLLIALPLLARWLEQSLRGEAGFQGLADTLTGSWVAAPLLVGAWALVHHLLAGLRHLLMDVGVGASLPQARASAAISIGAGVVAALAWLLLAWLR